MEPKSVLITGAARGLGFALAMAYAAPGVHLFLNDTRKKGMEDLCSLCSNLGAIPHSRAIDVRDQDGMENWISEAENIESLDLVIANAGVSHGNLPKEETSDEIREVFAVNVDGMLNTVLPVLPLFRGRKRGQIALMSSLAGIRGFPHAPSYCATKAAIRVFGQGLRARVKREGVSVCVMIPAFVKTPMTGGNLYHMPWLLEVDAAARIIKHKLAQDKPEVVFPFPYAAAAWVIAALPTTLMASLTRIR